MSLMFGIKNSIACIRIKARRFVLNFRSRVFLGRSLDRVPPGAVVFFPYRPNVFFCGLAGVVCFNRPVADPAETVLDALEKSLRTVEKHGGRHCLKKNLPLHSHHLGGAGAIDTVLQTARRLKRDSIFIDIMCRQPLQDSLESMSARCERIIADEARLLAADMGPLGSRAVDAMASRIEGLRDIAWCLKEEVLNNISKIKSLLPAESARYEAEPTLTIYKKINAVLNSIDRLEVRGRDSAGLSVIFLLSDTEYRVFESALDGGGLLSRLEERSSRDILLNQGVSLNCRVDVAGDKIHTVTFAYKIAAEIGRLGDNVAFLRRQLRQDAIFRCLADVGPRHYTICSHTRWASVGAITEANCHPVDNDPLEPGGEGTGVIHVCLNGDIDNYQALKNRFESHACPIPEAITTDTKIIPLTIAHHIRQGRDVAEAFRLAVNDFEGSHAISMHTDLAPGKLFLAQRGSGQSIYIGLADDHYMPVSEVYGFVEEARRYLKLDGEQVAEGSDGAARGQVFILDQASSGGLDGIEAMYYDATPVSLTEDDVLTTEITSRDIDRQSYPHYFLKEISEAPTSVEKTLQSRWQLDPDDPGLLKLCLDHSVFPAKLESALAENRVRRIFFIGQGTAGVAAQVCADIVNFYLDDPAIQVRALKSSELSGFQLDENDTRRSLADVLVVAISQSGTTTDTNRCVDMVKERGATTMAIVNRRESDLTFKANGVMYTSSGRDIEMSVASTKAFYSQIVAGALIGLHMARIKKGRGNGFISEELRQLLRLPGQMRQVLSAAETIEASAKRLATAKTYWAAVGSGPNKAAADEVRIKLSELCYKTISSDFVEDKKHIDLSSEPLIIVCAAGTRGTVIGDVIKDTAIFRAHKAAPVVIADEGETRFSAFAEDVIHVPLTSAHLAPILNTLVGHMWGYYAALAIHRGSRFLFDFRQDLQRTLDKFAADDMDVYDAVLEKSFREKITTFYHDFRQKRARRYFPASMGVDAVSDLTLLLKYLAGRLPVSDFELDFGMKGSALNMLNALFRHLGESINNLARPVDAIKHQAKTVTVGTSRISDRTEGILFDKLRAHQIAVSRLINRNVIVLRNLQQIVAGIAGAILYRITGLSLLGEPSEDASIYVLHKEGALKPIPSRVETDPVLKGTKRIIVRQGNVYIGKGRKDDRSILVIPILSSSPSRANMIENLLLLNITFKSDVPLKAKIKALGGKYEHIKNIVQENNAHWDDTHLQRVPMDELFGRSAEKIGERIIRQTI